MLENAIVNFIVGCWHLFTHAVMNTVSFVVAIVGPRLLGFIIVMLVVWWATTR